MRYLYTLDDRHQPVAAPDLEQWAEWMARHNDDHTLAFDRVGDIEVSTIFLGVSCWPSELYPDSPILWETMIFGGPLDHYQARYTSHDEALAGHAAALALVRGGAPSDP